MSTAEVFHAALSFEGVGADLENQELLQKVADTVIGHFGLTVVRSFWHRYQPIGLTGVYVLQQSSLTLHTWSEFSKLVIDVTTCGAPVDLELISSDLQQQLLTDRVKISKEIL